MVVAMLDIMDIITTEAVGVMVTEATTVAPVSAFISAPRITLTHIILTDTLIIFHLPLLLYRHPLRSLFNKDRPQSAKQTLPDIGIIATTQKAITHISRNAEAVGSK